MENKGWMLLTNMHWCLEQLIELLREFPPEEPTRKRYINEIISWSSRFGEIERGDPELHNAVGTIFAQGNEPLGSPTPNQNWVYSSLKIDSN